MNSNEGVAGAVAVAVVGLAMYEAVVLPGTATGLLLAVATLLQALASVIASLREK